MAKIIKNTTGSDIAIKTFGRTIEAGDQITIDQTDYPLLSSDDVLTEMLTDINSGDIVINDGSSDLTSSQALRFLKYPDKIIIQINNVDIVKFNDIINFQGAITIQDSGSGKTTVIVATTSEDEDPRLVSIECVPSDPTCIINSSMLTNHKLCFLKKEDC